MVYTEVRVCYIYITQLRHTTFHEERIFSTLFWNPSDRHLETS